MRPSRSEGKDGKGTAAHAPARHLGTEAEITVTGHVARAVVTQTFRNTDEAPMEGVYAFPLPGDAAVDTLRMQIGERSVIGEIRSRAEARKLGLSGESGAGTGLFKVEHGSGAMFTSAVPRIAPGDRVTVRLEYQQTLRPDDGVYSLRFPLAATPRPAAAPLVHGARSGGGTGSRGLMRLDRPAAGGGEGVPLPRRKPDKDDTRVPVSLQVRLDPGFPLGAIESASHAVAVERRGGGAALVSLEEPPAAGDTDFELSWKPGDTAAPTARLFRDDGDKSGYLLATIAPPTDEGDLAEQPREVIFALDRSGSMAGAAFRQARESLQAAISRLEPDDRFNIIAFDIGHEALFEAPVSANEGNKGIARDFLARLVASSGTRLTPALSRALADARPDETSRLRQVVLITDSAIETPQKLFSELAVKRGRSRLFPVGIGPAPDGRLLRRAAEIGRGEALHIGARKRIGERLSRFFGQLERPVLTDLEIDWPAEVKAKISPEPLPDLYAGEPLAISARTETPKGTITVSGKFGGKPWSAELDPSDARKAPGIARLWARRRIASLEALRLHTQRESEGIDTDIKQVALRHRLVSRMTGLVAVDRMPVTQAGDSPLSGIAAERIYPTMQDPAPERATGGFRQGAQVPSRSAAATYLTAAGSDIGTGSQAQPALEDTSPFPPGRLVAIGVMAIVFAAMSTLTLGLWRHLSRVYLPPKHERRRS